MSDGGTPLEGIDQEAIEAFGRRALLCAEIKGEGIEVRRRLTSLIDDNDLDPRHDDVLRLKAIYSRLAINREFAFRWLREDAQEEVLLEALKKDSAAYGRRFREQVSSLVTTRHLRAVRADCEVKVPGDTGRWKATIAPLIVENGGEAPWLERGLRPPPDFTLRPLKKPAAQRPRPLS